MKKIIEILTQIGGLFLLILSVPWFFTKSYSKWCEEQENAEENYNSLAIPFQSMLNKCKSKKEKEQLKEKINLIDSYFYLALHSGRTPDVKYPKDVKKVHFFLKRNNIDIYSDNFNIGYLTKCVREQDI